MDQKRILNFLRQLKANNNRDWFHEHKGEYDIVRADFEHGVQQAIERISTFDPDIAYVQVKDYQTGGHDGIIVLKYSADEIKRGPEDDS